MSNHVQDQPGMAIGLERRAVLFGLGTALCFSSSSIFIRYGLKGLPSPLIGVTIGMIFATLAYGVILLVKRDGSAVAAGTSLRTALILQLVAGVLVGLATWWRWLALDSAPIGVVITLGRLSVPVVLILSPFVIGRQAEQVTPRVWLGASLILAGSYILTVYG